MDMKQGSTSSPPPPEPFFGPSADMDAPDAGHTDNIEQTSSPPPPFQNLHFHLSLNNLNLNHQQVQESEAH